MGSASRWRAPYPAGGSACRALVALLQDPDARVRYQAVETLLGTEERSPALRALVALLQDPHAYVRSRAAGTFRTGGKCWRRCGSGWGS
ncbi:MAG: HEAT repeat domain-containing protein [Armatimonadetes bacterium]|nr:HEAT repeat domain-containing protein [Armatimonadota bacterium]